MKLIKFAFVLILFTSFACKDQVKIEKLNATSFKAKMGDQKVQLVDVRTANEYTLGFIEGARLITINTDFIMNSDKVLNKNEPVYVYCKAGVRSSNAASLLSKNGFTKIYDLQGGILSWQEHGFELIKK